MYIVKVRLGRSAIEGVGVFADEDIPAGTVIWQRVDGFDQGIDPALIPSYPPQVQHYLRRHAYLNRGRMWLCGDLGMFANHADDPNARSVDNERDIALRFIPRGAEITINYADFDEESQDEADLPD